MGAVGAVPALGPEHDFIDITPGDIPGTAALAEI